MVVEMKLMKIPFKAVGLSVLSLSLLAGGCGEKDENVVGTGSGSGPEAAPSFKPLAAEGVRLAVAQSLDKEQVFKVVDFFMKSASGMPVFKKDDIEEAKEKIEALKKDIFAECGPKELAFIEKSGLRDAKLAWMAVSLEDFKFAGEMRPVGLCVAVGGKLDLEKAIAAFQGQKGCDVSFEKTEVEGTTAWRVVPDGQKPKDPYIDPYVASLGGRLALLAISRDTLAKHIRLYGKGEGKGDAFDGFSAAKGEFTRVRLTGIGDLVKQNIPEAALREVGKVVPGGEELVRGLQNLSIDTKVNPDGMLSETIRLKTASEEDADKLRTLAKTGLMAATAQLSQIDEAPEHVKKMIADIKIGGSDGVVEVQSCIASAGIMAGALFPAISSAMLSAQTSAMSVKGRNLLIGMAQANVEREAAGLSAVWPRTAAEGGADAEDIAGRAYGNSTDYFNALFDTGNCGTDKWAPYVGVGMEVLSGPGAPPPDGGKRLEAGNVAWIVAANMDDGAPDMMPVLISANFNPALLLRKWDGTTDSHKRLPIGPASGAERSMFGDKAIVVVRKGGRVETIRAKYLTYATLYRGEAFDLTGTEPQLVYLTPTGAVEPVGRK